MSTTVSMPNKDVLVLTDGHSVLQIYKGQIWAKPDLSYCLEVVQLSEKGGLFYLRCKLNIESPKRMILDRFLHHVHNEGLCPIRDCYLQNANSR